MEVEHRIIVCGDRNWKNFDIIEKILVYLKFIEVLINKDNKILKFTIIHGDCRGADSLADKVARKLYFNVEKFPADWKVHGKAAGPIRNSEMLKQRGVSLVIAFHNDIAKSKGTLDCIKRANKLNIPNMIITEDKTYYNAQLTKDGKNKNQEISSLREALRFLIEEQKDKNE